MDRSLITGNRGGGGGGYKTGGVGERKFYPYKKGRGKCLSHRPTEGRGAHTVLR